MKKFLLILLIIMFTGLIACMDNKKQPSDSDQTAQTAGENSKLLPFDVESKITSTTVSNKIFALITDDILNWMNKDVIVDAVKNQVH